MHRAPVTLVALIAVLGACGGDSSPNRELPCAGNAGGGGGLTDIADMVYAVSFADDTTRGEMMHIRALFVGRGSPGWQAKAQNTPMQRPPVHDTVMLGGGSLGRLFVGYEDKTNSAWIHDQRVPLDSFNVVLVDRVDSVGGPPVVARTLRINPDIRLAPGVCGGRVTMAGQGWADSLRAVLMRNAAVREFASGR
jgi:hypothetical protein